MEVKIMDHFSELTYSIYADGELPEPEKLRVQQHLAQCEVCRRQVAAFETENRVLMEVFRMAQEEGPAAAPGNIARSLLLTVASALAVAVGLDRVVVSLERLAPDLGSWMNWFSLSWIQSFFFSNAVDLIREGPVMLNTLVTVLGVLVLGGIAIGVLRHFLSRHTMTVAVLATGLLAVALPRPAAAIETRHQQQVRVGPNETVPESLAATGQTINVEGTIDGNLIASGDRLVIRGVVKGDVFWAGHVIEIPGSVEGSVVTICSAVTISGQVGHTVYAWAGVVQLASTGHVGDMLAGGGDTRLDGVVGRDAAVLTGTLDVSGTIGRNLQASTNLLTLASSARVGGNLEAHLKQKDQLQVEPGATIAGKTDVIIEKRTNPYLESKFYFWQAIWMAGAFIVGLLLHWLAPGLMGGRLDTGGALLRAAGVGFLAFVAAPVAALVACVTLVGIPAGVLTLALFLATLWIAKVFVAAAVGRSMVTGRSGAAPSFPLALLAGLVTVFVAINLPYHVGGWLTFLVILVGFGLVVEGVRDGLRRRTVTP
jgi:anti-sigma factor RsiW/cytoskeletal protein CcmA (bactofilin family)